jgi:hypothetical protein
MNDQETTTTPKPRLDATPAPKRPSWAIGDASFGWGRVLHDISWHGAMGLPGITKRMREDIDRAAEEDWGGVEPATRKFLLKFGIDRVHPL